MRRKRIWLTFEYVIAGLVTRGGTVSAETYEEARQLIKLRPEERIWSLTIKG